MLKPLIDLLASCVDENLVVRLAQRIDASYCGLVQQGGNHMAAKINRSVIINGTRKWIRANSEQEYAEKLAKLFGTENN